MKSLLSIWIIVMSVIWVFHVSIEGEAAKTRGLSSAMQLEADLYRWADANAPEEAVREIFSEDSTLLLGGEHPSWTFREMIEDIALDAVPPLWPGLIGLLLGGIGLLVGHNKPKQKAVEQGGDRDAEEAV